jgi:hypothetical protein
MDVGMRVWLARVVIGGVLVLVVLVVNVPVRVLEPDVVVHVVVPLAEVQPGADRHQDPGHHQGRGQGLAQDQDRGRGAEEGR